MYIILTLENTPFAKSFVESFDPRSTLPIVASGLLKYEKKVGLTLQIVCRFLLTLIIYLRLAL